MSLRDLPRALTLFACFTVPLFITWFDRKLRAQEPAPTPPADPGPGAGFLPLIAAAMAWKSPDPEISLVITACTSPTFPLRVTTVTDWGKLTSLDVAADVTPAYLLATLDRAAARLLETAPSFRIKEPVLRTRDDTDTCRGK